MNKLRLMTFILCPRSNKGTKECAREKPLFVSRLNEVEEGVYLNYPLSVSLSVRMSPPSF